MWVLCDINLSFADNTGQRGNEIQNIAQREVITDFHHISHGVTQGSALGLLLFVININDYILHMKDVNYNMYNGNSSLNIINLSKNNLVKRYFTNC